MGIELFELAAEDEVEKLAGLGLFGHRERLQRIMSKPVTARDTLVRHPTCDSSLPIGWHVSKRFFALSPSLV
jgi:hypothetical protein